MASKVPENHLFSSDLSEQIWKTDLKNCVGFQVLRKQYLPILFWHLKREIKTLLRNVQVYPIRFYTEIIHNYEKMSEKT